MLKRFGVALIATMVSVGAFVPDATAQGICWNGKTVRDLKDCPKQPGTKLQSPGAGGNSAMPQGMLSGGEKKSKAAVDVLKLNPLKGEAKD